MQTIVKLPKKTVKTVAKGLKAAANAPESLLSLLTADETQR